MRLITHINELIDTHKIKLYRLFMVTKTQLEEQNRTIQELRELIVELQKKVSSLKGKQKSLLRLRFTHHL